LEDLHIVDEYFLDPCDKSWRYNLKSMIT